MRQFFIMVLASVGLISAQVQATSLKERAQTSIYDFTEKDVITVNFESGSHQLSADEKTSLRAMTKAAREDSAIDHLIVVSWADKELPVGEDQLSDDQKELAEKRGEAVKKALDELGVKDVKEYSMAEKPTWFGNLFGTRDAKVKKAAQGKSVDDRSFQKLGNVLEENGGAGKAVVILRREIPENVAE